MGMYFATLDSAISAHAVGKNKASDNELIEASLGFIQRTELMSSGDEVFGHPSPD